MENVRLSDKNLLEHATAFIKDGKLIKWRYDNEDPRHIDNILNVKMYSQELLTKQEIDYILGFLNVIIIEGNNVEFKRFSGNIYKY